MAPGRAAETLASTPPATRFITILCILLYAVVQCVLDVPISSIALNPSSILIDRQLYRLITGALFHANLMHIFMNMTSTMAMGKMLERRIGTMMTYLTIAYGILLSSCLYVAISWLLFVTCGYAPLMKRNCVGFSGVIFHLSVLETNHVSTTTNDNVDDGRTTTTRSVFGLFEVSSRAYPYALLVAIQFIMPHVSFLGHLSGIITGTMQCHGLLDRLFPSYERLREWEILGSASSSSSSNENGRSAVSAFVTGQSGYVAVVTMPETRTVTRVADMCHRSILSYGVICRGRVFAICEALRIIIFGRGGDANANARMPDELGALWGYAEGNETTMDGVGDIDNDDEWVGLPEAIQRSTEIR